MGNTMLGIFYLVEKKVQEELKVFRLPFYLTLLFIAVGLLQIQVSFGVVVLLGAVWAVFLGLYLFKQNATVHRTVKKIIECCKNW